MPNPDIVHIKCLSPDSNIMLCGVRKGGSWVESVELCRVLNKELVEYTVFCKDCIIEAKKAIDSAITGIYTRVPFNTLCIGDKFFLDPGDCYWQKIDPCRIKGTIVNAINSMGNTIPVSKSRLVISYK